MNPIKAISIRAGLLAALIGGLTIPTLSGIKCNQGKHDPFCPDDHKSIQKLEKLEKK